MKNKKKWRISDIIEAIEQEQGGGTPQLGERLRVWANGEDMDPVHMLRNWFESIPRVLGLPALPYPPPGGVTPAMKDIFQKLVSEAKRLNVPRRG